MTEKCGVHGTVIPKHRSNIVEAAFDLDKQGQGKKENEGRRRIKAGK